MSDTPGMDNNPRPQPPPLPTPRRLIGLHQLVLHQYDDGMIQCTHQRMDQATRRMIPHELYRTLQDHQDPFTPPDLLFIGAAELVANELGYDYRLPF